MAVKVRVIMRMSSIKEMLRSILKLGVGVLEMPRVSGRSVTA